jgi:hypothetical protein
MKVFVRGLKNQRIHARLGWLITDCLGFAILEQIENNASAIEVPDARKGRRRVMLSAMVKTLEQALAEVSNLPDADQEKIGRRLLAHVEKLRRLRADIDAGIRSLDAGDGRELNIEEFIRQKNKDHGGA